MVSKNFIECIRNSIGTQMFRSYYVDGVDVLENGNLSCAYYVSSIMLMFKLIDRPHFRVDGTIKAMVNTGWQEIEHLRPGCVVIWNPIFQNGKSHFHIGFYIGDGQAISNRSSLGSIGVHPLHYSGLDKDEIQKEATVHKLYWHPNLE